MDRQQRVIVEGEESSKCTVDSGVPQGTVLGPFLFLCHINDLPLHVNSQVRLFADDCLLYREINKYTDHIALQEDLKSLEESATNWGMKFNATKCFLMSIHRSKSPSSHFYSLNNHILQQVQNNPYLGAQISENLKWTTHINKICNQSNSILGFIRRNLKHCNRNFKETAYISLVRSVLDYASIVWDPYQKKDIDSIEGIQGRAARFVMNNYSRGSSVTDMMSRLNWRPLAKNQRAQRNTKSKSYKIITCSSDIYKNSFVPRTIKEWNLSYQTN